MEEDTVKEFGAVEMVDTEWLDDNLDREDLLMIDCQPNVHDYISEHIPGAVYFNQSLLRVPEAGRPAVYVPEESMEPLLRRIGVTNERRVLVYTGTGPFKGWGDGLEQTFVAYTLVRFGVDRVMVLDGGIDKWKSENRPLTKEYADVRTSRYTIGVRGELFIDYREFQEIKDEIIMADECGRTACDYDMKRAMALMEDNLTAEEEFWEIENNAMDESLAHMFEADRLLKEKYGI